MFRRREYLCQSADGSGLGKGDASMDQWPGLLETWLRVGGSRAGEAGRDVQIGPCPGRPLKFVIYLISWPNWSK